MGNNNSVENYVSKITSITVNTIVESYQSHSQDMINTQTLGVDCSTVYANYLNNINNCYILFNEKGCYSNETKTYKQCTMDELNKICSGFQGANCVANQLRLSQQVAIDTTLSSSSIQWIGIKNDIIEKIQSNISQQLSLGSFNNKVKSNIENVANVLSNNVLQNFQQVYLDIPNQQTVNMAGGNVNVVNLESTINYVNNILQNNEQYTEAVNELAVEIYNNLVQETSYTRTLQTVLFAVATIIIFLIIIGIVLFVAKLKR